MVKTKQNAEITATNGTVKSRQGFTLIEILVVIGLIAVLAAVVIIAINPARQFAQGRNSQRTSNVNAILNAIGQRMADNKGKFENISGTCTTILPSTETEMEENTGYDIRECIVPTYMSELPFDPNDGVNTCVDAACDTPATATYDTQYTVLQDATTKRVTVCAPQSVEVALGSPPEVCITR